MLPSRRIGEGAPTRHVVEGTTGRRFLQGFRALRVHGFRVLGVKVLLLGFRELLPWNSNMTHIKVLNDVLRIVKESLHGERFRHEGLLGPDSR